MCDPLTIAGIALTAGSVAANSMAASQAAHARTEALQAERQRQNQYNQEAQATNATAQGHYKDFQGQQDAQAQNLAAMYTGQQVAPPPASDALPTSASNLVVNEEDKQNAKAKAFTDNTGTALANLQAFGQALGADSRETARDAGDLSQINNFKAGSSAVLPYELDAASSAGNGLKTFGDILGGLGSVGVSAGLRGGSLGSLFSNSPTVTSTPTGVYGQPVSGGVPRLAIS